MLDPKLPLKCEFLRLSRQLLCQIIWGKLFRGYVIDGEQYTPTQFRMDVYDTMVPGSAHLEVAIQKLAPNYVT